MRKKRVSAVIVDDRRGIYFGLTRCDGRVLVAARNLDAQGQAQLSDCGTNVICSLRPNHGGLTPVLEHECLRDLHQIRAIGCWLCVVLGHGSQIAVFDRRNWRLVRLIELDPMIPPHLRHAAPDRYPEDPYHFNSLTFSGGSAFVLAHNWGYGSFALELDLNWGAHGPGQVALIAVHEGLGHEAHDIIYHQGGLHFLNSAAGNIVLGGQRVLPFPAGTGGNHFPRGIAMTQRYILAGYGTRSEEQAGRRLGSTHLCVFDTQSGEVVLDAEIGKFGNTCDILLLNARDISDQAASNGRRQKASA